MKLLNYFIITVSLLILPKIVAYQNIYQLEDSDNFYAYATQKQCFVPANYSELGSRWYMHPEQFCLSDSDAKHLHRVVLSREDARPLECIKNNKCKKCSVKSK